ncbi:hypothetical protein [Arthrobacter sp. MDT1-65]
MSGFSPHRVDRGVRAGGQFAHSAHAESVVTLSGSSTLTVDETSLEAPLQASPRTSSPAPSQWDLADAARTQLTAPIRAAETVSDMDRALAAYASRTTKSGTWHDYLPDLHGGLPNRSQLLAAMRAFEDAPKRLANLPSVRAATDALAVIERRKAEFFAQRRNHERTHGSLAGFTVPRPDISAERIALASAAPAAAGEHVREVYPTAAVMTFRKDSTGNLFLAAAFDAQRVEVAGYRKNQLDPKSQKAEEIIRDAIETHGLVGNCMIEDEQSLSIHIDRARAWACYSEPRGPQAIHRRDIIERRPGAADRVVQPRGIFRPTA